MNSIVLTPIGSSRVYAEGASASPGFLTFLTFTDTRPPSLTVAAAWSEPALAGYFVMLAEAPADLTAYALALEATAVLKMPAHTGFAWAVYESGSQTLQFPSIVSLGADGVAASGTAIEFRNYRLLIHEQTRVILTPPEAPEFVFVPAQITALSPGETATLRVSFTGKHRFCWLSQGLINDFSDSPETGWDAAIRFYSITESGALQFWRYPFLRNPEPGCFILFEMTWDPLRPLDEFRTFLAFTRTEIRISGSDIVPGPKTGGVLASALRTIYGGEVGLYPLLAEETLTPARLVFSPLPGADGNDAGYTLVPAGDFEIRMATDAPLLCGLSGTEFIQHASGQVARFHPGNKALLRKGGEMSSRFLTSWLSFDGLVYSSQPIQSALFDSKSAGKLLELFSPDVRTLAFDKPFPMAAYGGLIADAGRIGSLASFEGDTLTPARYSQITTSIPAPPRRAAGTPVPATTPQGFLAAIDGSNWKQVTSTHLPGRLRRTRTFRRRSVTRAVAPESTKSSKGDKLIGALL